MTPMREAPRLCLVFETKRDSDTRARLEKALEAASPPSLILSPGPGVALDAEIVSPLITLAQAMDVAVLIEADVHLAQAVGADGVHLPWSKELATTYVDARKSLGPNRIVGADAGRSRHDAMSLGEQGADYLGFGIPPHVTDRETAAARRRDLVQWWAEIFEVPVIAFDVETPDEAADLAGLGADFVAVRITENVPTADLSSWLGAFSAALPKPEPVT